MAVELERARKTLRELSKTLKSLPDDPAPKQVHKLRTATRRVEAIAAALAQVEGKESRRLLKSIEPVRKAAGGVRDMDVLIANARKLARNYAGTALTRLIEQLQIARQHHAEELHRALSRRREAARENLKEYSKLVRAELASTNGAAASNGHRHPHDGVHVAALQAVRELAEWPPLDEENIHAFRLKVKELRYVLQLSADTDHKLLDALGNVQRRIGDWHDWQHLDEMARELFYAEPDEPLLERIGQTTRRRFDRALAAANALRGKYMAVPPAQGI